MIYSLLQERLPSLIIEKETKAQYVEFLATQNVEGFFQFVKERLDKEQKIIQAFQNMDQERIKYE